MKAEEYLHLIKAEIEENLKENPSTDIDEKCVANYIKKIIDELKPTRYAQKATISIINKYFGEKSYLKQNGICPQQNAEFIENWVLKILNVDDTYQFASNYLQQRENRRTGNLIPLKDKSKMELISLIDEADTITDQVTETKGKPKNEWTAPVFALFLNYLMNAKYENYTRELKEIKRLCDKHKYKKSYIKIRTLLYAIGNDNNKDNPLKKDNLQKVKKYLKKFERCIVLVENDLKSEL